MAFDQAHADTLRELDEVKAQRDTLLDELASIRDLAFRGAGHPGGRLDALGEIHRRAASAVQGIR
jgi:hypothetical protein